MEIHVRSQSLALYLVRRAKFWVSCAQKILFAYNNRTLRSSRFFRYSNLVLFRRSTFSVSFLTLLLREAENFVAAALNYLAERALCERTQ